MIPPTPLELLQIELNKYKKALRKSGEAHKAGKIDIGLHIDHKRNLEPIIESYQQAIQTLIDYKK